MSAAARLLRSWVRIPPGASMFVCCECCVFSGRGLCGELITRPEESYRLWCVVVCNQETSRMRRPWPALGHCTTKKKHIQPFKLCKLPKSPSNALLSTLQLNLWANQGMISNFPRVLKVVCFPLGNSPVSEPYMPFRNTLSHLHTYPPMNLEQTRVLGNVCIYNSDAEELLKDVSSWPAVLSPSFIWFTEYLHKSIVWLLDWFFVRLLHLTLSCA